MENLEIMSWSVEYISSPQIGNSAAEGRSKSHYLLEAASVYAQTGEIHSKKKEHLRGNSAQLG
jgi:hypothetical protein